MEKEKQREAERKFERGIKASNWSSSGATETQHQRPHCWGAEKICVCVCECGCVWGVGGWLCVGVGVCVCVYVCVGGVWVYVGVHVSVYVCVREREIGRASCRERV